MGVAVHNVLQQIYNVKGAACWISWWAFPYYWEGWGLCDGTGWRVVPRSPRLRGWSYWPSGRWSLGGVDGAPRDEGQYPTRMN